MFDKFKKASFIKIIFLLLVLGSLGLLLFYLFYCTSYIFHSDMATRLLLASEQRRTGELFPSDWCNTTGILVGLWELILIPFMAMIKDWILCREIAVLIQLVLLCACIIWFFKCAGDWKLASGLCLIFMCFPIGQYEEGVYDASYTAIVTYSILVNILLIKIMDCREGGKKGLYALLGIVIFLSGYGSMRNYVVIMLPAVLSVVLYYWIDFKENFVVALKKDRGHITLVVFCAFCMITLFVYRKVSSIYPVTSVNDIFAFSDQVAEQINQFVNTLFSFYGASGTLPILSISGIRICLNFVFMIMSVFVAPIYFLLSYKKTKNRAVKMFTIYAWVSDFVVVYMMIFSTADTPRYFTTVYFHNIIFLALFLAHFKDKVRGDIRRIVFAFLCCLVVTNHLSYFSGTVKGAYKQYQEEKATGSLYEFLAENDLKYGVASYWNAYNNMCKSDGEITIVSCLWNESTNELYPEKKYFWGTSKYYFNPANYPGRSFLLLAEGETVAERYYELASAVKNFKQYTILIFNQNIYSYDLENIQ